MPSLSAKILTFVKVLCTTQKIKEVSSKKEVYEHYGELNMCDMYKITVN